MENIFKQLFANKPLREENDIYYFGDESDGDWFDESDFEIWQNGFDYQWRYKKFLENPVSRHLADEVCNSRKYVIDLACGPGMGFIPTLKQISPHFSCLATDANPSVLSEWRKYLDKNEKYDNLCFAQFSVFDLPFENNSVHAYSSFIGISSTRNGENDYISALSEIRRTLAAGGAFYTVENEPEDTKGTSWHDRFVDNGFEIVYEKLFYRILNSDDADKWGVGIGTVYTTFIVRKNKYPLKYKFNSMKRIAAYSGTIHFVISKLMRQADRLCEGERTLRR